MPTPQENINVVASGSLPKRLAFVLGFVVCALAGIVSLAFVSSKDADARGFSRGGAGSSMARSSGVGRSSMGRSSGMGRSAAGRGGMGRGMGRAASGGGRYSGRGGRMSGRYAAGRRAEGARGRYGRGSRRATTSTHARSSSGGSTHRRSGSAGTHARSASYGGGSTHRRSGSSGGDTHRRYGSAGGTHARYGSSGDGGSHYRYGSASGSHYRVGSYGGHQRYGSFARVPLYTPPVPPPMAYAPPQGPTGPGGPPRFQGPRGPAPRVFAPPPQGEFSYVPDQVLVVVRDDLTEAQLQQFFAEYGLVRTGGGERRNEFLGERMFRLRIANGRSVPAVIAAMQNDPRGVSAVPNYIYRLTQMETQSRQPVAPRARTNTGAYYSMQYVIAKLQLQRAHQITRGERVLIAVIDSGVDEDHPELAGTVVKVIDVTDNGERGPHAHGTAMTGAIVAQTGILGVAPGARVVAIRTFSPTSRDNAGGTTWHVQEAIYRAIREQVRIINMSLAGPADTRIEKAVAEARARGIVVVAAAGNNGPSAPAAYPAAYPGVIAVTATDNRDQPYTHANRGNYIAIAAPGVDVFVVAPNAAYSITSGTSIATAHITGIIALMLSRNPMLDPDAVRALLLRAAKARPGEAPGASTAGLIDAYDAVVAAGGPQAPTTPVAAGRGGQPTQ